MALICYLNGFLNTSEFNKSKNCKKARTSRIKNGFMHHPPTNMNLSKVFFRQDCIE